MSKILFISAFPLNQRTAGQDYSRRLLEDLVSRGHKVSLIYTEYPSHELDIVKEVKVLNVIKPSLLNCFRKPFYHPVFTRRFRPEIMRVIQQCAQEYDLLYFDYSQVHIYAKYVHHPCKVLMCHDILIQKYKRKKSILLPYVKRTESNLLNSGNIILTFSQKDNYILKDAYNINAIAVNFYIKTGHYKYFHNELKERSFCLYGAWNRPENVESLTFFVNKILPSLNDDIEIKVIGGGMKETDKEMLSRYSNVKYEGFVDDPVLEISKNQALIAPLHLGAGVKVKVIDALTSGTPVIGTNIAFEGIEDNENNKLLFTAELPDEYIKLINEWCKISIKEKQLAANEFSERYNKNHFPDIISDIGEDRYGFSSGSRL